MSTSTAPLEAVYTRGQFAFFRVMFGVFLCQHFGALLPYASELYSQDGMLPSVSANLTYGYFPNVLSIVDSTWGVRCFLGGCVALSLAFAPQKAL